MFYWVLLGFTGFYWVLPGFDLGTEFYRVFHWVLLSLIKFYRVMSSFIEIHRGLLGFNGFYRVFLASKSLI